MGLEIIENRKPLYFDTSCFMKLFHSAEDGAKELEDFIKTFKTSYYLSSAIIELEFHSGLRRIHLERKITESEYDIIIRKWQERQKKMSFMPVTEPVLKTAYTVLTQSKFKGQLRTLDCIHFASYQMIKGMYPETVFISADKSLCRIAEEYNVEYFNPLK